MYPESDVREGDRRSVCGNESMYCQINGDTVETMAILDCQDVTLIF